MKTACNTICYCCLSLLYGLFFKVSACFFVLNRSRKQSSNQMVEHAASSRSTQTYHNTHANKHTPTPTHTHTRTHKAGRESRQGRRLRTQVENEHERAGKICTLYHPPERVGTGRVGSVRAGIVPNIAETQTQTQTQTPTVTLVGNNNKRLNFKGGGGTVGGKCFASSRSKTVWPLP